MFESSISLIVQRVMHGLNVTKPSEMTNEQLTQLITESIYKSITSDDYIKEIDERLAKRARLYGRGIR